MNILQFIEEQYPIKETVKDLLSDPYKRIAEMDDLPYDKIGPDETGEITKLVEIDDVRTIPVLELISYTRADVLALNDPDLLVVYDAYMEEVDIEDVNFADILACVKRYKAQSEERRRHVLSLQKNSESGPT